MAKQMNNGNSVASNAAYMRELVSLAEGLMKLNDLVTRHRKPGVTWGNMTIRPPGTPGGEWMAILRTTVEEQQYVAFVSGSTLHETLRLVSAKLLNESLKWKRDEYTR